MKQKARSKFKISRANSSSILHPYVTPVWFKNTSGNMIQQHEQFEYLHTEIQIKL